jgi:hypothetical protein
MPPDPISAAALIGDNPDAPATVRPAPADDSRPITPREARVPVPALITELVDRWADAGEMLDRRTRD